MFLSRLARARLVLSMTSPREVVMLRKSVDSVTVPGAEGTFTLTDKHSPTVARLQAGPITVRDGDKSENYFISDGWVIMNEPHNNEDFCTAQISAVELVPADSIDKAEVALKLQSLASQQSENSYDQVKKQLGSSLLQAMMRSAPGV